MGVKRVEREGSFTAVDGGGNVETIDVYVEILDAGHMGDGNAEIKGMRNLKTRRGRYHVNSLGDGKFHVLQTGQDLKADSEDLLPYSL